MSRTRSVDLDQAAAKASPTARPSAVRAAGPGGEHNHAPHPAGQALLALQRSHGNQFTQRAVVQAKLAVGAPGDRFEREADQIAQAVVRGTAGPGRRDIQSVGRPSGSAPGAPGLQQGIQRARGRGQAIPDAVRAPVEQALGTDLSGVRLHTDGAADRLSHGIQARAFTSGQDIFLRRGQASLTSPAGRELIAHELTHVAQQGGGGTGEGVVQRKLWQINANRVYDDVLIVSATRDTGRPHVFVGDVDGLDYKISGINKSNPHLKLAPPAFTVPTAPATWSLTGTKMTATQNNTAAAWAPPAVDEHWQSPYNTTEYSHSPGHTAYEPGLPGLGTEGSSTNREAAGYQNPNQFAKAMLPLWKTALWGTPWPSHMKTAKSIKAYMQTPTLQFEVADSFTTKKIITGYQQPSGKSAVVLGHHPGASASATFNSVGHTQPRKANLKWNKTTAAYHGLEDYIWSSKSAKFDPKYEAPRPDRGSHRSYWDSAHPKASYTGGPWRSWDRVPDANMVAYIDKKITGVPATKRDHDHVLAQIELDSLKLHFSKSSARELLAMIKSKGW